MTKPTKAFYFPGQVRDPKVSDRKLRFDGLNEMVRSRGTAWLISQPGLGEITVETLPASTVPDELRKLNYVLTEIEGGERILAGAITERFYTRADGERELLTEGSTQPVSAVFTHAGIVKTRRFTFDIP